MRKRSAEHDLVLLSSVLVVVLVIADIVLTTTF